MLRWSTACCAALLLAGCPADDDPAADAAPQDADVDPGADVFDPCPGQLTFETGLIDAATGEPPGQLVTVTELGTGNQSTSAPNGRALLCLDGGAVVSFSTEGYLERRHVVTEAAARAQARTGEALPIELYTPAAADELVTSLGLTRDADTALVYVEARDYPEGTPLAGVGVTLDAAFAASFSRDTASRYGAGTDTGTAGGLLFVNAEPAAGASFEATSPTSRGCSAPDALDLEAGVLHSTLVACE